MPGCDSLAGYCHNYVACSLAVSFSMYETVMGQTTREKLVELIDDYQMGDYLAHALIRRMTTDECRDLLADLKAERI